MKKRLEEKGFAVTLSCISEFRTNNLKKVKQLLILVSTYGEGDPPNKAVLFHELCMASETPRLEGMRFSVLGLGDQLYDQFCKTGKDFDARLEEFGEGGSRGQRERRRFRRTGQSLDGWRVGRP